MANKRQRRPKPARKPKQTKAVVVRRVEEVLRIILDGAEFWDVREYAREMEAQEGSAWHLADGEKPLSDGQLRRYVTRAHKLIAESNRASRGKLLRRHLAQRRNLYAKAVSQGDVKAALAVLKDEADLLGLYDPPPAPPPDGDAPLTGPADVVKLLADTIRQLRNGRLSTQTAGALASVGAGLIKALETTELAARVAALEAKRANER
jgi:hypothetical protein